MKKLLTAILITTTVALGGAWVTSASGVQIRACVNKSTRATKIVTRNQKCKKSEKLVTWSASGATGATGSAGAAGATFQAATAVAVTADATLTTDEVLTSRLFVRADGAVASDVYLTTPKAYELIAALTTKRGVTTAVGDTFEIICINNESTNSENFDISSGTGVTFGGSSGSNYGETLVNETVARFMFVVTNVTASSEAIVFYRV